MSKILIADDDTNFLNATSEILNNAGFTAIQAKNPAEFMQKAASDKPDLILLDTSMEKSEDGLLAGKELFTKGIKIPIIILENVAKAAAFSIDTSEIAIEAYAEKPLDKDKILTKINAILNR